MFTGRKIPYYARHRELFNFKYSTGMAKKS